MASIRPGLDPAPFQDFSHAGTPLGQGQIASGPASLQGFKGMEPDLTAPAGSRLGGKATGGTFLSFLRGRATTVPYAGKMVSYESRFPSIIAGMQIHCDVASREEAEGILESAKENLNSDRYPTVGRPGFEGRRQMTSLTGALANSLYVAEGDWWGANGFLVASDLEYAPFVEFGSVHNWGPGGGRPKPYLRDALEEHKAHFITSEIAAVRMACFGYGPAAGLDLAKNVLRI